MKGMKKLVVKRFIAMLLAAVFMVASVPAMKTEAAVPAPLTIKAKFVQWDVRDIQVDPYKTWDCAVSYIGIDASYSVTAFEYMVYTQDGSRLLKSGSSTKYYISRDGKYKMVRVPGGRRTVLTSVRIRAKIKGKWSAWTGLIGLIPLHTPDYTKVTGNYEDRTIDVSWSKFNGMSDYEVWVSTTGKGGWKLATRTTGSSYTIKNFGGKALQRGATYYVKVIGRAKVGSTLVKAKGDADDWYVGGYRF